jgi:hypothetical protein
MRIDWYTKGVLTVIAVLLAAIALRPYVSPEAVAHAQGSFAGVEFSAGSGGLNFFDTRTGEIWGYSSAGPFSEKLRVAKLGQPLIKEK